MTPRRATQIVKSIIVDLDAALASNGREALDERHSALASAMMLGVRLIGGSSINLARLASASERIAAALEEKVGTTQENPGTPDGDRE